MIPKTLYSIKFEAEGTGSHKKLFVRKIYLDGNGVFHDEAYQIDPESAVILQYCWIDDSGSTRPEKIVWEV